MCATAIPQARTSSWTVAVMPTAQTLRRASTGVVLLRQIPASSAPRHLQRTCARSTSAGPARCIYNNNTSSFTCTCLLLACASETQPLMWHDCVCWHRTAAVETYAREAIAFRRTARLTWSAQPASAARAPCGTTDRSVLLVATTRSQATSAVTTPTLAFPTRARAPQGRTPVC
jgi:hypothetical protein